MLRRSTLLSMFVDRRRLQDGHVDQETIFDYPRRDSAVRRPNRGSCWHFRPRRWQGTRSMAVHCSAPTTLKDVLHMLGVAGFLDLALVEMMQIIGLHSTSGLQILDPEPAARSSFRSDMQRLEIKHSRRGNGINSLTPPMLESSLCCSYRALGCEAGSRVRTKVDHRTVATSRYTLAIASRQDRRPRGPTSDLARSGTARVPRTVGVSFYHPGGVVRRWLALAFNIRGHLRNVAVDCNVSWLQQKANRWRGEYL